MLWKVLALEIDLQLNGMHKVTGYVDNCQGKAMKKVLPLVFWKKKQNKLDSG